MQAAGRQAFRQAGLADADQAFIFFHGLGLEHIDMEITESHQDWAIEDGMLVSAHLQVPGDAQRMTADALRESIAEGGRLLGLLLRYTHTLFTQVAQTAACNRVHEINQVLLGAKTRIDIEVVLDRITVIAAGVGIRGVIVLEDGT